MPIVVRREIKNGKIILKRIIDRETYEKYKDSTDEKVKKLLSECEVGELPDIEKKVGVKHG
jgi:hypothetical protein